MSTRYHQFEILNCQCSSGVEQLFCKQPVVGSNPATGSLLQLSFITLLKRGGIPKWPNGADCKSVVGRLRRFESCSPHNAGVAQLVERHPSKVNVAGSSPVARSLKPADIAQG